MNKEEFLSRAKDHCFFVGLNDSGAEICKANTPYGMAGIHYVQQEVGLAPDATFISTPDMTITRNTSRWTSGFGYGGKISWGQGEQELVILNVKPNACGMLVGGLQEKPEIKTLIGKLHEMERDRVELDGIEVGWDFYKSNHFIDIFEVKPAKVDQDLPPYAFIIHGSADEFRGDNHTGFGLYYDKSQQLYQLAEHLETPYGTFHYLTGASARQYYEKYKYVEDFSRRKKRLAAEILFGDYQEISNEIHQGLININEIVLGCHHFQDQSTVYPLTLRGDLPAYLVKGKANFTAENVELLGFEKRARKLGVYDRLLNANIIPHGGGYVFPDILSVNQVIEVEGKRYFEVDVLNDRGKKIISEVRELPYEYRGRKVVLRALETDLIEIIAKLIPLYVFKI